MNNDTPVVQITMQERDEAIALLRRWRESEWSYTQSEFNDTTAFLARIDDGAMVDALQAAHDRHEAVSIPLPEGCQITKEEPSVMGRLDALIAGQDSLSDSLDEHEKRLDKSEHEIRDQCYALNQAKERIDALERRLDELTEDWTGNSGRVTNLQDRVNDLIAMGELSEVTHKTQGQAIRKLKARLDRAAAVLDLSNSATIESILSALKKEADDE